MTPGSTRELPGGTLSIGAVAELTGVSIATLRAWETRHGFPASQRDRGTHRRYSETDVAAIQRVVSARQAGYSLEAAIAEVAAAHDHRPPRSIYAAVRERWPMVTPRTISRTTMLAISRAIEDECCARAAEGTLIAAFQTPTAYAPARARWDEYARTARRAIVLAEFDRSRAPEHGPLEVAVEARAPLLREWAVVCDAPNASACLVGWEHPDARDRAGRLFEAVWTVDPAVTRAAAAAALTLAAEYAPDLDLPAGEPVLPPPGPADAAPLVALTDRIVTRLDAALGRAR